MDAERSIEGRQDMAIDRSVGYLCFDLISAWRIYWGTIWYIVMKAEAAILQFTNCILLRPTVKNNPV